MNRILSSLVAVAALAAVAASAAPVAAQPSSGMAALRYYVGNWTCVAKAMGEPASTSTLTGTLDGGVLRMWVWQPAQGKMRSPYGLSMVDTYDAKMRRYVSVANDSTSGWSVGYGTIAGMTERWIDQANAGGPMRRSETMRRPNSFTVTAYPSRTATRSDFKVTCTRA